MEHKVITGGEAFLPFARSRIKALRATVGLRAGSQQFEVDGVSIKVRITGAHEYIIISGNPYEVLSGVVRDGEIIELPVPPGSPPGTLPKTTLRSYKPTQQAYDFPLKKDPDKSVDAFNDEPRLAVEAHVDTGVTGSQYAELCASMYSGLMAKAVQVILGYGKPRSGTLEQRVDGVKVPYDHRFERCHGITVATDEKLWLVEISIDRGVLAMPLPTIPNSNALKSSKQDVLKQAALLFKGLPSGGTFPKDAELTAAIAAGDVLRVKTPEELDDFYLKSPFSPLLGWSFNDTGTEAHNTCYRTSGDDVFGCHYKLAIAIGDTNTSRPTGAPIAPATAELSLQEEGPLTRREEVGAIPVDEIPFSFTSDFDGTMVAVPAKTISEDVADTDAPILVCHINGVLDVVRVAARQETSEVHTEEDYEPPGLPVAQGQTVVTALTHRRGRSITSSQHPLADMKLGIDGSDSVTVRVSRVPTIVGPFTKYEDVIRTTNTTNESDIHPVCGAWGLGARDGYALLESTAIVLHTSTYLRDAISFYDNDGGFWREDLSSAGDPYDETESGSLAWIRTCNVRIVTAPSVVFQPVDNPDEDEKTAEELAWAYPAADWTGDGARGEYAIRFSAFGPDPQVTWSDSIRHTIAVTANAHSGTMLAAEESPSSHKYSFIGYIQ